MICVGQTATLSATGAFTYLWNTSAITAAIAVSPTTTTIYSVMGTDSLGCKDSAGYMVTVSLCTGINNLAKTNFLLQANPNPNNGDFSVRSDVAIKLEILNELGQIVQYLTLDENNNYRSNVSGLSSGVYFVIGNHDGQIVRNKIVVTK